MKHESPELMLELAAIARTETSDVLADPGWEAVAAGTASVEERARLYEKARSAGIDDEALLLFEPLTPRATSRLHAVVHAEIKRRPLRTRLGAAAGVLALAAAIAVFVGTRGSSPALPGYELSLSGGVAQVRGAPEPSAPFPVGSPLVLSLRPATPVTGPLEARAELVRGENVTPLAFEVTTTSEGAVRLSGVLPASLEPGPAEVIVTLARPGGDAPRVLRARVNLTAQAK